jgi:hypothetical protein
MKKYIFKKIKFHQHLYMKKASLAGHFKNCSRNWMGWCRSAVLVVRRQRQVNFKFKASLSYTVRLHLKIQKQARHGSSSL